VEKSSVISEYVERLASELNFDPSLARCVRREVEDHLWEAVLASPPSERLEAEQRAVANFGDPHVIATQFAIVWVAKQARRVGAAAIIVIAAVFIAMKVRLAWYSVMECSTVGQVEGLGAIVASIDRYAFWLSAFAGIAGWLYIDSRRTPAAFNREYRRQLRRFFLLCFAATGALIASVISDGVLMSLRLVGTGWSLDFLIPLVTMAIEVVCAGVLVLYIRGMTQRTASTGRTARMG
jgi:hypothetical protein